MERKSQKGSAMNTERKPFHEALADAIVVARRDDLPMLKKFTKTAIIPHGHDELIRLIDIKMNPGPSADPGFISMFGDVRMEVVLQKAEAEQRTAAASGEASLAPDGREKADQVTDADKVTALLEIINKFDEITRGGILSHQGLLLVKATIIIKTSSSKKELQEMLECLKG